MGSPVFRLFCGKTTAGRGNLLPAVVCNISELLWFTRGLFSSVPFVDLINEVLCLVIDRVDRFVPRNPAGSGTNAVDTAVQNVGDIRGNAVVVVEYRIRQSHFVHFVFHLDHFVGPLVVLDELFVADLLCTVADLAEPEAVEELAYALRIVSALDEAVGVDTGGDIVFVCLVVLRHRYKEYVLAERLGPLGFFGAQCPQPAGVEQQLALADVVVPP